jgi:putative tryptophan/tyrosine transport system substrate-binding protein
MRRRKLLALLGSTTVAGRFVASAPAAGKSPRVGLLLVASAAVTERLAAFRDGMRQLGYREGENIVFELRLADGVDRLEALATELVQTKVDVIVTSGHPSIRAAQRASKTIPIVVAVMSDPVEEGFAASYARPDGNTTGLAFQDAELTTKRLQILKEVVPPLSHVAVLWDPQMPASVLTATASAAHVLGLSLDVLPAGNATEVGKAFDAALARKAQALFEVASPGFAVLRAAIAEAAVEKRLPAACEERGFVAAGCLVSYGPSFNAMFARTAYYVDKIIKGTKPADLPIEQPTKFELVINLKTARLLGLTMPPSILAQADELIE